MVHWLPENISSYGVRMDAVFSNIYYIVGAWFLLAEAIFFISLVAFRRRKGRKASYLPGHSWKAMSWVLIPAVLVLGFDLVMDHEQVPVWREIKENMPPPDQKILVKGKQFVWDITHAGPDGKLGTADDKQTMNQLYVPVDQVVEVDLQSEDVIHSFWIPNMRFKQDVVPGRSIKGWFKAIKTGDYKIGCAELCGVGHGNMGGWIHVLSAENYQKWLKGELASRD
ncbi:MAG: cytochrome c oxidase subunit II [bacterium]